MIKVGNGEPNEYWDGVKFVSHRPFHLEYIYGLSLYENNGIGADGGYYIGDDLVNKYVSIGYNEMDGIIPAGYQYDFYTTIKVKVVFDD